MEGYREGKRKKDVREEGRKGRRPKNEEVKTTLMSLL